MTDSMGDAMLRELHKRNKPRTDAGERALALWKLSGEPCFWCWAGDERRTEGEYDGESLAGLHVITGNVPGAPNVFMAGCAR
jgi:hypothetical protein